MDLSEYEDSNSSRFANGETKKVVRITSPVVCRVKPSLWWLVPVGALEAGFMLAGPFIPDGSNTTHPDQPLWIMAFVTWPTGLLMGWAVVWILGELVRGEIRADETGLTWRRAFHSGWKRARWNEITDYYLERPGARFTGHGGNPGGEVGTEWFVRRYR